MPYPNEHACRIRQPNGKATARKNGDRDHNGKKYDVIYQEKGDGKYEDQAYRYPAETWDAASAKAHCDSHSGIEFEAATGKKKESEPDMPQVFVSLDGVLMEEGEEGKVRSLIMAFPRKKKLRHPYYGELNFDDVFFDEIIENYTNKVLGNTLPFIDQDHDERGAAGWITGLKKAKKGLYAEVEWTDIGIDLIKRKIYRYFSPSYGTYENPETGKKYTNVLRGGGLTNVPFLKMMPPIEFTEKEYVVKLTEYYTEEKEGTEMNVLEEIKKILSVEKDEEVGPKVKILLTQIETLTAKVTEFEKTKTASEGDAERDKKLNEALESNKALSKKIRDMERDKLIGKALSEGRMIPEKKKFYEDLYDQAPEVVAKAIGEMPVVVNLAGPKGHGTQNTEEVEPPEVKKARAAWGQTEEDVKKYGG